MTTCRECGNDVSGIERQDPCPHCGSSGPRDVTIHLSPQELRIETFPIRVEIIRHWTKLIRSAEQFFSDSQYGVAVVVAATACEVIVERAMSKAFSAKNIPELEEAVMKFLTSCALHQVRNRKLYDVLAADEISNQSFWQGYLQLVEHRNQSVHSGHEIPQADARTAIDAATKFVTHVESHNHLA